MDDFKKTYPPGKIPKKWTAKYHAPFFGKGDRAFIQFIHKGPGEHYIHMASGKDNYFSLAVLKPFWTKDWPVLEWEWKITKLPKGADVRVPKKDDQAGSVCLIIDLGSFGFGSALCYLYENSGPKHKVIHHPTNKKSRYFFLRTGKADGVNRWYKERRNIFEDYRKAFGKALKKKGVIVFQIDSNSTETSAEAFYRNIYQRKR